jgi:branched-chain amino acid transport system substrate-binding protein
VFPTTRRRVAGAAAAVGLAVFCGPWKANRAFARTRPIRVGLTCDASGIYGTSGSDDLRGIRMAIAEINAEGGVLGRPVEWVTADTETNPDTGVRVAHRFIDEEDCALLIGAIHSGVAAAITKVASAKGVVYLNTPIRRRRARRRTIAAASSSFGTPTRSTSPRQRS